MVQCSRSPQAGAGDAGRVTGEPQDRPDPEVPEKARRRTFTAQYSQEVLAAGRREGRGPAAGGPLLEPDQRVSWTGPALLRLFKLYDVKPRERAAADLHETSGVM